MSDPKRGLGLAGVVVATKACPVLELRVSTLAALLALTDAALVAAQQRVTDGSPTERVDRASPLRAV